MKVTIEQIDDCIYDAENGESDDVLLAYGFRVLEEAAMDAGARGLVFLELKLERLRDEAEAREVAADEESERRVAGPASDWRAA